LSESKEATRAAKEVLSKKRGELEHSSAVAKKEQELEAKEELQVDREKADVKAKAAAVQAEKEGIIAAAKDVEAMQAKAEKSNTKVLTGALKAAKQKLNVKIEMLKEAATAKQLALDKAQSDVSNEPTEDAKKVQTRAIAALEATKSKLLLAEKEATRFAQQEETEKRELVQAQKGVDNAKARVEDDKMSQSPTKDIDVAQDKEAEDAAEEGEKILVKEGINLANKELHRGSSKQTDSVENAVDPIGICGDGKLSTSSGETCDDRNQKDGDGCDSKCRVERGWSCAGGSPTHHSVCDQCGNGIVGGQEDCDDRNRRDGDGCSSLCRQEAGFTCQRHFSSNVSAVVSKCMRTAEKAEQLMQQFNTENAKCAKTDLSFMMTDIRNGKGTCVDLNTQLDSPEGSAQVQKSFVDASLLTKPNKFYQRLEVVKSCPLTSNKGGISGVAVCKSESTKVCLNSNGAPSGASRSCKFQVLTSCKEVCVAPRFCAEKKGAIHGTDLAGSSLIALIRGVASNCRKSPDVTERKFAEQYFGAANTKLGQAVKSTLYMFDKDKNGALSFMEVLAMLQKKPWSALLRKAFIEKKSVSITQVKAVLDGKGDSSVQKTLQKLFDRYDIDGSLEVRDGVAHGKACCFRNCKVPQDWDVPDISWCYDQHVRVSVGL